MQVLLSAKTVEPFRNGRRNLVPGGMYDTSLEAFFVLPFGKQSAVQDISEGWRNLAEFGTRWCVRYSWGEYSTFREADYSSTSTAEDGRDISEVVQIFRKGWRNSVQGGVYDTLEALFNLWGSRVLVLSTSTLQC